jgi:hypothetical protein
VLVEYAGHWPREPLDAAPLAGRTGARLRGQLDALPDSKLALVKPPAAERGDGISVVLGTTPERGGSLRRLRLGSHLDLLELDLADALARGEGEPVGHPLLLVCTHGARDRCCARRGTAACRALSAGRFAPWLWQSSHVGGHRFAANLVALPEGLYFGHADDDPGAVAEAYAAGRIELDRYRGRAAHSRAVQAAELHVRRETGLDGLHDLRLLAEEPDGERTTVELLAEVAGVTHRVVVEREDGPEVRKSCRDDGPSTPSRFAVRAHERGPAAAGSANVV